MQIENSWLYKRTIDSYTRDVSIMSSEYENNELLSEIGRLHPDTCYTIFRVNNDNIYGLKKLYTLIGCMEDDGTIGVVSTPTYNYIGYVNDSINYSLDCNELLDIIRTEDRRDIHKKLVEYNRKKPR